MDKLRAIELFCRAAEARSFASAARSLDVVPSALSKAIAGLEAQVGAKLMTRSTRRLALTEEGTAYYEQCRQLLDDLKAVEEGCREGKVRPRGVLRIGMHPAFRMRLLNAMGAFLDAYPEVRVETVMTNSPAAVFESGLDLLIHVGMLADSSLVSRRLGWTRAITCAAPRYLDAAGEPRTPANLSGHRAVIYGRPDEDRKAQWVFVKGQRREVVEVKVSAVTRDGIGLVDAAVGGAGIARPFEVAIGDHLARGQLRAVLSDWSGERQPVCAVTPSTSRNDMGRMRAYLDFVAGILNHPTPGR